MGIAVTREMLEKFLYLPPHNRFLGLEFDGEEQGVIRTSLTPRSELVGDPDTGVLHGGVVTTMLDATCGVAVMARLGELMRIATLDLRIDYLKPSTYDVKIYAEADCFKVTQQVAFVSGTAYRLLESGERDELAKATATFMLIRARRGAEA